MPDDAWPLWPRRWFETRRHARRRHAEFQARFNERHDVWTMPDGRSVATLRAEWWGSKNSEELGEQR